MSTSSRLSKSLSRDSQHLFLASTEPVLRNSVLISIDSERLSSAESSSVAEKDDSRCSQQNPFSETSRYVLRGSSPYANFISANFISKNFISTNFVSVYFISANFIGSNYISANLISSNLISANFISVIFQNFSDISILLMRFLGYSRSKNCTNELK